MKIKNSLYGLWHSPKSWFGTTDHHLAKIGYLSLESDSCVYVFGDDTGFVILTLYVDEVLPLGANKQLLNKLKIQLVDCFEMKNMGDMSRVFGINVTRDREK